MPILISEKADTELLSYFPDVIKVQKTASVYDAVSCHPDIYYCRFSDGSVFVSGQGEIGESYPHNIGFNAVCLDKYFIHNLKYTNPRLLEYVRKSGFTLVNVRQGYTKCSCVVVDGSSIITADDGIYSVLSKLDDINILKVTAGYVRLPGFEFGFLGGASGRVGDTLYFAGDITRHPDFDSIRDFVLSRGVKLKWFNYPLEDVGSIIEFNNMI